MYHIVFLVLWCSLFLTELCVDQGHNCAWEGPPAVGEHIQVRWTDGDLYGAVFRGVNCLDDYTVSVPHDPPSFGEQLAVIFGQ